MTNEEKPPVGEKPVETDKIEIKKENFDAMKSDMLKYKDESKTLKAEVEELKNKKLSSSEILEALGVPKEDGKSDIDLVKETLAKQNQTIEQLQNDLSSKEEKIALREKQIGAEKIAQGYNFIDVEDVLAKVDWNNEDIEGQIKNIAETKKHWIKPISAGNSYHGLGGEAVQTILDKQKEALKKGDITSSIALKLQLASKK